MADEPAGDWFADAAEDLPPPVEEKKIKKKKSDKKKKDKDKDKEKGDEAPAKAEEEQAKKEGEEGQKPTAEDEYLDPDKLLLFKHWIRPKFLQYKYLFDYRRNYYDDVLDYLDKRQKGVYRDIPVPQTWAERALRTYNSKINKIDSFRQRVDDTKLVTKTKLSGAFHLHHSKNYISRRYSSILL